MLFRAICSIFWIDVSRSPLQQAGVADRYSGVRRQGYNMYGAAHMSQARYLVENDERLGSKYFMHWSSFWVSYQVRLKFRS